MDPDVKRAFSRVCEQLGLSSSEAINAFAKEMIRRNGFPFALEIEKPSQETMKAIDEAIDGKNLEGPFSTTNSVMDSLDS